MALGRQAQETTLGELFDALSLEEDAPFLEKLTTADRTLRDWGVEVQPRLQDEPPGARFLLRQRNRSDPTEASVVDQLAKLESASQEFKLTYWCNHKRRTHDPRAASEQLRSEEVKHSALKAIAGFLTTGGGTLFIGVRDDGQVLGIEPDLQILQQGQQNVDHLINNIKTDISARFYNGNSVNDYVSIAVAMIRDDQILRVDVASRRRLSCLKSDKSKHQVFRRQDNRTVVVEVFELEEFIEWREEHILAVEH